MKPIRQGDVLLIPVPVGTQTLGAPVPREDGRVVLAHGEVTGHAHAIAADRVELYETTRPVAEGLTERFMRVLTEGGATLWHGDLDTITADKPPTGSDHTSHHVPVGEYIVRTQREWQPEAFVRVAD